MTELRLPRLPQNSKLTNPDGTATIAFQRWWQRVVERIEDAINNAEAAQMAADAASGQARNAQVDASEALQSAGMDPSYRFAANEDNFSPPVVHFDFDALSLAPPVVTGEFLPIDGGTMRGAIKGAEGTVGAPGYAFSGDADTGFYHPAANEIGIGVNGTAVMRITSTGLGIGTAVPAYKLDVALHGVAGNVGSSVRFGAVSDQYSIRLFSGTDSFSSPYCQVMGPKDAAGFIAFTAGASDAEVMRVTPTQVGIGETLPDYKLDVNGSFGFAPGASVTPTDNGDIVFQLTSDTLFTIKAKGSDGTIRSADITLA